MNTLSEILGKLKGGDRRSIGRSEEVVQDILNHPALFGAVFEGIFDGDPIVRMRSADAIEKVSSKRPEYLQSFKTRLVNEAAKIEQQEVRWHVAQMFSYLELNSEERDKVMETLYSYIDGPGKSSIVKVFSIQALANLAERDGNTRPKIIKKIEETMKTGSPAMVSRSKKLLKKLKAKK